MSPPATKSKVTNLTHLQLKAFEKKFPLSARKAKKAKATQATPEDITAHQWAIIKKQERNEKARIRMAKRWTTFSKRAALKAASAEEQAAFVQSQRAYEAKYRAGHRRHLAVKAERRRNRKYKEEFGQKAFITKRKLAYEKRVQQEIKQGLRDPVTQVHDAVEDLVEEDSDCWTDKDGT
ncbi:hypothetical protein B0H11DRAFT_1924522 [Mycena galericulata]|nr:hypothetical protein B0H11DRAFT_1924522 [Mycena galericulata]